MKNRRLTSTLALGALLIPASAALAPAAAQGRIACESDNGGITLPAGFCAVVVGEVASARHMAVAPNGDLYVTARAVTPQNQHGVTVLRDTNGDGKADVREGFSDEGGTGIAIRGGNLYFATNGAVLRYRLGSGPLPASGPDTVVSGLPAAPGNGSKSIALGDDGSLYVDFPAPTDACQPVGVQVTGAMQGEDPCTQLETRGGVWRFDADKLHQTMADGERFATGIRAAIGITWNAAAGGLYAVQQGREHLEWWPAFGAEANLKMPAEELLKVERGGDYGWPYCLYDPTQEKLILAPEYGGDSKATGRCAGKAGPVAAFQAHWAPNDVVFYTGTQFPAHYRGGAFIAFHGKGNPAVPEQRGYRVEFVPFRGATAGTPETFAGGFATGNFNAGKYRPGGLAVGPDGSLYIADSQAGRIWRVVRE
jgi:glucose/arabinose dehydrogenase